MNSITTKIINCAVNINHRWNYHREDLRKNKHASPAFQNHFNEYGEQDLQFSILCECTPEELIPYKGNILIETYFINFHRYLPFNRPYFNVCEIAGSSFGRIASQETLDKFSEIHKGQIPWNKGKKGLQVAWNKGFENVTESAFQELKDEFPNYDWDRKNED